MVNYLAKPSDIVSRVFYIDKERKWARDTCLYNRRPMKGNYSVNKSGWAYEK